MRWHEIKVFNPGAGDLYSRLRHESWQAWAEGVCWVAAKNMAQNRNRSMEDFGFRLPLHYTTL